MRRSKEEKREAEARAQSPESARAQEQATEAPGMQAQAQPQAAAPVQAPAPAKRPSQRRWWALAAVLALLIAALALALWWLTTPNPDRDGLVPDPNVKVGSLSGDFADLDKIVDEGMLTFSINATPSFPSGTEPGNLMIENAEINNNRFTVAIYRNDTGEKIYESGSLDPGQYIEEAPLDVDLAEGVYECTAQFSTYKLADNTPIGQAAAEVKIYVQG